MPPTNGWRTWRAISLLFGVLLPLLVWGFLLFCGSESLSKIDAYMWLNIACVTLEVGGLGFWLFKRRRTRSSELVLALVFVFGVLFAGYWCMLGFVGLASLLNNPKLFEGWNWLFGILALSPFPCVPVYGANAVIAFNNALQLKPPPAIAAST